MKSEKSTPKEAARPISPRDMDKVVFQIHYNPKARTVKIGELAIPTWLLYMALGALLVLLIQALFAR